MNVATKVSVSSAPTCNECKRAEASLRGPLHGYMCTKCAQSAPRDVRIFAWASLLAPRIGNVVVLPDEPRERARGSLIIIPRTVRDSRNGKLSTEQTFTGHVVGCGPGYYCRDGLNGAWLASSPGVGKRKPMPCEMWDHVIVHAAHEQSTTWWRGLAIVGAPSIMASFNGEAEPA